MRTENFFLQPRQAGESYVLQHVTWATPPPPPPPAMVGAEGENVVFLYSYFAGNDPSETMFWTKLMKNECINWQKCIQWSRGIFLGSLYRYLTSKANTGNLFSSFFFFLKLLLTTIIALAKIVELTPTSMCPLLLPSESLTVNGNNIRAVGYSGVPSLY